MSWLCSCGLLNSGLNEQCAALKQTHEPWTNSEHEQVTVNTPDHAMATALALELSMNSAEIRAFVNSIRTIPQSRLDEVTSQLEDADTSKEEDWLVKQIEAEKQRRVAAEQILAKKTENHKNMTPQEELYAKFYEKGRVLVKGMPDLELNEHIKSLQEITFEAKVSLQSALDEKKERIAKVTKKEWLLTDTTVNPNVSEAINAVKLRQARMSKMDKIRADLAKAGLDDSTINDMVRGLEKKATDGKLKTLTFNRPTKEITAVQIPASAGEKKPLDVSSFGFKKKENQ